MGTSAALELARAGADVTVLERAIVGAEASTAAAGIIGAEVENEEEGPMLELCRKSRELYPAWIKRLEAESQVSVGFLEGGALRVFDTQESLKEASHKRRFQLRQAKAKKLNKRALSELEPGLTRDLQGALYFPTDRRVTPSSLFSAAHIAAARAGVNFVTGTLVKKVVIEGAPARARGVLLDDGSRLHADVTVIAAGSWTNLLAGLPLVKNAVVPARGQLLSVRTPLPLVQRLIVADGIYLIARADGQLLIGSTLEFAGYQKGVSAGGAARLLSRAVQLIPALQNAMLEGHWSNFRPYTADHLPLLGSANISGLIIASGHYRNGILLAPITAKIVCSLALGRRPPLPLAPFDPLRLPLGAPSS